MHWLRTFLPKPVFEGLHALNARVFTLTLHHMRTEPLRAALRQWDLNVCKLSDFYSPLPDVERLVRTRERWARPSELAGVKVDLEAFKTRLRALVNAYGEEFRRLPEWTELNEKGFGPGFPWLDGVMVYAMVRDLKPKRYIEIGSGLSTAYAHLAAEANRDAGHPLKMTCIDPYPSDSLRALPGVEIVKEEAQAAPLSLFYELEAGDILLVDSTHVLKIDGDVPYLYLEVLPHLKRGVMVHVHDIAYPYNVPYPPEKYLFDWYQTRWPVFWNEAMVLQAFLAFNDAFRIVLSVPMLRFHNEEELESIMPGYLPVDPDKYETHCGSIWIEKVQ